MPLISFLNGGEGLAINKAASTNNLFDINMNTKIGETLTLDSASVYDADTRFDKGIILKNNNITNNTTVSENQPGNASILFKDSEDTVLGWIDHYSKINGDDSIRIFKRRTINNTNYDNGIYIGVDSNGNQITVFQNENSRKAFIQGLLPYYTTVMTYQNSTSNGDSIDAIRYGQICCVSVVDCQITSAVANGNSLVIGTLPEGFCPFKYIYGSAFVADIKIRITTTGEVRITNRSGAALASGSKITFTMSYLTSL